MTYSALRVNGGPTQYDPTYHVAVVDILAAGFILAFCMLGFAFFLIAPGFPGIKRLNFIIRVIVSLFIGSAILLGVLGQDWVISELETKTPYKAFSKTEINGTVGARIGLGSVNVTLKGNPVDQVVDKTDLPANNTQWMEHIDYNERFTWAWQQGRFGFGPYAGRINREFRDGQNRGLPLPILWIAEYFTLDGELIRWGRSFRTAGWYTWQVLWTAFPLWLIANALSVMVLSYCGITFILTGLFMEISVIIYATIRFGTQPMEIPFEDGIMHFNYGTSFWLTMAGGIVSILYGVAIWMTDFWYPHVAADFFGIDVLQDSEEFYHKEEETEVVEEAGRAPSRPARGGVAKRLQGRNNANKVGFSKRFGKSNRRKSNPDRQTHSNNGFDGGSDAIYDVPHEPSFSTSA